MVVGEDYFQFILKSLNYHFTQIRFFGTKTFLNYHRILTDPSYDIVLTRIYNSTIDFSEMSYNLGRTGNRSNWCNRIYRLEHRPVVSIYSSLERSQFRFLQIKKYR